MITFKIPTENHCFTEISWFLTQVIRVGRSPHSDVLFGSGFPGTAWILVMKWSWNEALLLRQVQVAHLKPKHLSCPLGDSPINGMIFMGVLTNWQPKGTSKWKGNQRRWSWESRNVCSLWYMAIWKTFIFLDDLLSTSTGFPVQTSIASNLSRWQTPCHRHIYPVIPRNPNVSWNHMTVTLHRGSKSGGG